MSTLVDLCERWTPSVVAVGCMEYPATYFGQEDRPKPRALVLGSGFVVAEGLIATNAHVANDLPPEALPVLSCPAVVGEPVRWYTGKIVLSEGTKTACGLLLPDIALVQVTGRLQDAPNFNVVISDESGPGEFAREPVPLGSVDDVRMGDDIAILGYPLGGTGGEGFGETPGWPSMGSLGGFRCSVTHGVVACIHRGLTADAATFTPHPGEFRFLELDAITNPGNSGGPVFLIRTGEVVGILTWGKQGFEGRSWAFPVDFTVKALARTKGPG